MGLRMKNFNIMGVTKKSEGGGVGVGGHKKTTYKGELPKKGAWTVCRLKWGGAWQKRGRWYF